MYRCGATLIGYVPGDRYREQELHGALCEFRDIYEWYHNSGDFRRELSLVRGKVADPEQAKVILAQLPQWEIAYQLAKMNEGNGVDLEGKK